MNVWTASDFKQIKKKKRRENGMTGRCSCIKSRKSGGELETQTGIT